jgi:hypothetical protein
MGTHSTARDHTSRRSGADPHADSDVLWARETHRTTPHTHHTDLLLVWNEAARAQLGGLRSTPRWWQPCAGVYRQRQGAGSHDPSNPPTTSRRCHGHPAWEATGSSRPRARRPCTPHGTAWSTRSCPSHRAAPRPPVPRHTCGQHHLHGRIACVSAPQGVTRRAIVHAVWRSNLAAPARWLPR